MPLPRDESGGRCSLGQNSATEGPVCQIGLAGSWLPQAKTTWGRAPRPSGRAPLDFRDDCRCRCGASLRRADEGVRPYVDVLILPDFVFRFMTGEFGRLAIRTQNRQKASNAPVFRKRRNHSRIVSNVEVVRQGVPGSWPPRRGSGGALYSPYLLARNLPTSDSIWP